MRNERKDDHIYKYLKTEYKGDTLLGDVYFETNALPELNVDDIDPSVTFCGKTIGFPLLINAMTGGTDMTEGINQDLAMLARDFNLPMQVGSQRIALEDPNTVESFTIVRSVLGPEHVVLGNLGALATVHEIERALDMLQADAIGLHLNVAQELCMKEGDRHFRGTEAALRAAQQAFPGRILVKEVGFGLSKAVGRKLRDLQIPMIDVGGAGGTNFLELEDLRNVEADSSEFYDWGIPTAQSLLNIRSTCPDAFVIAGGGLRTASDMIRAGMLGADLCAMSGEILRYLLIGGYEYTKKALAMLIDRTKTGLLLLGCRRFEDLRNVPHRLTGKLAERVGDDV
uniref:type 2 isopentenyl-diphosphate Delta-isomerase n=1 Tax=Ndongobacter massiliensis TaxID=1871025 RepID=UPI0009301699|nr:type 2 isopentenyl-diphosphate Delta-isomerase [Ndongobacter massiliensis]